MDKSTIDALAPAHFPPQAILITGATGFIGRPLLSMLLERGCTVTALTRNRSMAMKRQPSAAVTWVDSLSAVSSDARFDVVINLAGESLAKGRWTSTKKQRLIGSRVDTTAALYNLVERLHMRPRYLVNGSAVGFYGPQQDQILTETSESNDSFSHRLCAAWEHEADRFGTLGMAVCRLRLGVVLAKEGGAFEQIKQPFRYKVATQMGSGEQFFSWIHRQDLLRIFALLLGLQSEQRLIGPLNASAPGALSYEQLAADLAVHYHTFIKLPLPRPILRPLLGQMADELLLSGQRVQPEKLLQAGFCFRYPDFRSALPSIT